MYTKLIEHVICVSGQVNTFQVNFPANSNYTVRIFCRCPANRGCTVIVEDADRLSDKADVLGTETKERYCFICIISSISGNVIGIKKILLLSHTLLIGWQLSVSICCKTFFSLLYNCQLLCFWRLALSIVVQVFPRPFFQILLLQGCLLQTRYAELYALSMSGVHFFLK